MINVLLVEDHALTRIGLKTVIKRTDDINVIGEATNGLEAIEMAESLMPDVILMDVGMPKMNGIQAAKAIVEKNPQVRIIMLTQHDNDRDIMASLASGASGYCLKDVEPERLFVAIRAVSAGDAWLDESIAAKVLRLYSTTTEAATIEPVMTEAVLSESSMKNPAPVAQTTTAKTFDRPAPEALSPRETEVLTLIVEGLSNQGIADKLIISLPTAKTHVRNILNKLSVDDRTQAAVHAMRRGLI
ncbi:MAG: response regulator transcription factor [Candidatus Obscuribacterales bacterium]|nr:response regulator transcription factor [Candidatus Obscuribacterales bacterium]